MRKLLLASLVVLAGYGAVCLTSSAEEKASIKEVMKVCMKGGLCKKVADGNASDDEKKQLVSLFTAMAAAKPPKGSDDSWKEKTTALVDAAKAAAEGKDGAGAALKAAANCAACHKEHKG
ncbi:MAG: hypothetical protein SFU86_01685 [Pirellulaceae bacterium]|nr:hypothetical protein [Pirellulaceae bacterium]